MPAIPQHYSKDFLVLIESMLNSDPKKRPSVGRILRDQFIKKNIMLFLERTKLKFVVLNFLQNITRMFSTQICIKRQQQQHEQIEKENKYHTAEKLNIQNENPKSNDSDNPSKKESRCFINKYNSDSETDFKVNENKNSLKQEDAKSIRSSSSQSERIAEEKKSRPRVRISSVVEHVETKEYFKLKNDFDDWSSDSDETHKPYELTKPFKNEVNINNYEPDEFQFHTPNKITHTFNVHQPKVLLLFATTLF